MSNVEESMGNLVLFYTARNMYSEIQLLGGMIQGYMQLPGHFLEGIIRDGYESTLLL